MVLTFDVALVVDADNVIADNGMANTFPVTLIRSGSDAGHNEYAIDEPFPGDGLTRLDRLPIDKPIPTLLRSVMICLCLIVTSAEYFRFHLFIINLRLFFLFFS